ncbi:hypothetical protein PENTCL1PPCAC_21716, partial [Pristionchus entomophagus]
MLILLLLFISNIMPAIDTCVPTSPRQMPSPPLPCTLCAPSAVTAIAFTTDTPSNTATGCKVRTLECATIAISAYIKIDNGAIPNIDDGGTGTATLGVTCNADGSAWTYQGTSIAEA